jgi:hypothetical protein
MTEITEHQADKVIDALQKTFAQRRLVKNIVNNKDFKSILTLKKNELTCCLSYIERLDKVNRVLFLTNIVDYFTDKELRNDNLKSIFSKFRNELECIV